MIFGGKISYFCKKIFMNAPFIDIHTHRHPLATTYSKSFFCYGVHPWWLTSYDTSIKELDVLRHLLEEDRIAAIGETGIDRLYKDTLPYQQEVFEKHILLSEQFQKPIIGGLRLRAEGTGPGQLDHDPGCSASRGWWPASHVCGCEECE